MPAVVPGSITMLDEFYSHDGAIEEIMATRAATIEFRDGYIIQLDRMVRVLNDAGID